MYSPRRSEKPLLYQNTCCSRRTITALLEDIREVITLCPEQDPHQEQSEQVHGVRRSNGVPGLAASGLCERRMVS